MSNNSSNRMVRVRPANNVREAYEVPANTPARAVDSMAYIEIREVKYIGAPVATELRCFGAFSFVELDLDLSDLDPKLKGKVVVYVDAQQPGSKPKAQVLQ